MYKEELIKVESEDGQQIALWKISATEAKRTKNIFLTHGTFSNRKALIGISNFLAQQGFVCWIMEWRNHGASSTSKQEFDFETIAHYDFPAVFNYLFGKEKINSLSCITHSGGGIILSMFLIKHQAYISQINSIVFFGCQAFGAAYNFKQYSSILIAKYLGALLKTVPASKAGAREHDESYTTMKQWFNWNLQKNFVGNDGFDYLTHLKSIKTPILSICAEGDHFIAPKIACEQFLNAFDNKHNQLRYFSKNNGDKENYNHSRILLSRNAESEIWPLASNWIDQNEQQIHQN